MTKKHLLIFAAVVGIVSACGLAWWVQAQPKNTNDIRGAAKQKPEAIVSSVEVTKVLQKALQDEAQTVGTLRSSQSVMLRPEVAGRVRAIGFKDGDTVRKGQLLVQLDDTLQRAELKQAQAQISIAEANFKRNQELVAQNFVAQRVLDESAATLQVAQAQVALVQARLDRMAVLAPFDGTAGLKMVSVGDYVRDGADLVGLQDLANMEIDFRLPEQYQYKLKTGQAVRLSLDALGGKSFQAKILAIDPLLDANGRSIAVRARVSNPSGELRPGMFARVTIVFGSNPDALVVPEQAIVPQGGKQYVIKVDSSGKEPVSLRQEVQLGLRKDGWVQVEKGLALDETIVVAGQQRLQRDGTSLRILETTP